MSSCCRRSWRGPSRERTFQAGNQGGPRRPRKGRLHERGAGAGGYRPRPCRESAHRRVPDVRRGGGACGGAGESEGRADRDQGPHQREGAALHVRVEDPRGLCEPVRRDGHQESQGERLHLRGAREHGRVRDGLLHGELRAGPHGEPLRRHARAGRQLGRQRGRRGRRPLHRGARHGYGRVDSPAGELLQLRGPQAELWTREPFRRDGVCEFARPGGPDDEER